MKKKVIILVISAALILTVAAGSTIAFLTVKTNQVENSFTPAVVTCSINEQFTDGDTVKRNVTVTNTGNVNAFIRAAIVVNWVYDNGNIMPIIPQSPRDYTIVTGADWEKAADGYYYYNAAVAPGQATTNLIDTCQVILPYSSNDHDDAKLSVQIIASAIQSEGIGVANSQQAFAAAGN